MSRIEKNKRDGIHQLSYSRAHRILSTQDYLLDFLGRPGLRFAGSYFLDSSFLGATSATSSANLPIYRS